MPPKPKRGRPPLPEGASKEARLVCRLLESEAGEIKTAAKKVGKTKSEWIREVLLEKARSRNPLH